LREIVVPRRDVVHLGADLPTAEALRMLARSGHSRAPVTGPVGLDEVIGVVHVLDLLDSHGLVGAVARPAVFLPETLRVSDALRQLRQQRQHLAVVVDERGSTDGIVTLEDLVEEIVGEIYDETDRDGQAAVREDDGGFLLVGGSRSTTCPTSAWICTCPTPALTRPSLGWSLPTSDTFRPSPVTPSPSTATSPRSSRSPDGRSPRFVCADHRPINTAREWVTWGEVATQLAVNVMESGQRGLRRLVVGESVAEHAERVGEQPRNVHLGDAELGGDL
jgi:hypothetical protein